ncbi:MAG: hypothetical protein AB1640_09865 [bacterium]
MRSPHVAFVTVLLTLALLGCATRRDVQRIDSKLNTILSQTHETSLGELFDGHSSLIAQRIDQLDENQRKRFDDLLASYQRGAVAQEELRQKIVEIVGGEDREVSAASGVLLRDAQGNRVGKAAYGSRLEDCRMLRGDQVPAYLKETPSLSSHRWGTGTWQGERIVFAWDLTVSGLTKEVVEASAKRTAQEFLRMGGDKQWSRPVYIQLYTQAAPETIKVKAADPADEVHLLPGDETPASGVNPPVPEP